MSPGFVLPLLLFTAKGSLSPGFARLQRQMLCCITANGSCLSPGLVLRASQRQMLCYQRQMFCCFTAKGSSFSLGAIGTLSVMYSKALQ
jgi:hypothetical protein